MHHILYMSTAVGSPTDEDLKSILIKSRQNNEERNVTGMLLYTEGTFVQILEGQKDDVKYIYKTLLNDHRHKNLICLIDGEAKRRTFSEWWMGFTPVNSTGICSLKGYLEKPSQNVLSITVQDPAVQVLRTFVEHNMRILS